MSARCRSCGERIIWAVSEFGRAIPLDATPYDGDVPSGQFVLRDFDKGKPTALAVPPDAFEDEPHYRSHFATCPDADDWRRGTRRGEQNSAGRVLEGGESGPTQTSAGTGLGDDVPVPSPPVQKLLELLRGRVVAAQTANALLEHELDELHDPQAIEHATIARVALLHLAERLDELLADRHENVHQG